MKYSYFEKGECLYFNPLTKIQSIENWKLEGQAKVNFENERLILENKLDPNIHGDNAHWVFWCPTDFPDKIIIEWDFYPLQEPGLCMMFFAATARNGEDIFQPSLPKRQGKYPEYHSGSINALHLSYFRHKYPDERAFRTCNLRKSHGFHLVAQGADPLPPVEDADSPYHMKLVKYEGIVQFSINNLTVLEWEDEGTAYGPILNGGKIGIRQMAPMKASYENLAVYQAILKK